MKVVATCDDDIVDSTAPVHLLDLSCRLTSSVLHSVNRTCQLPLLKGIVSRDGVSTEAFGV
jgi:hypothetical protein